jgi:hypothetical protein
LGSDHIDEKQPGPPTGEVLQILLAEYQSLWEEQRNHSGLSIGLVGAAGLVLGGIITLLTQTCDPLVIQAAADCKKGLQLSWLVYALMPIIPLTLLAYLTMLLLAIAFAGRYLQELEVILAEHGFRWHERLTPSYFRTRRTVWQSNVAWSLWGMILAAVLLVIGLVT